MPCAMLSVIAGATPSAIATNGLGRSGTKTRGAPHPTGHYQADNQRRLDEIGHPSTAESMPKTSAVVAANAKPPVMLHSVHDDATLSCFPPAHRRHIALRPMTPTIAPCGIVKLVVSSAVR